MRIKTFDIQFYTVQAVFESGNQVRGNVLLDLEKPLKLRSLKLFFIGKSKSWWDERQGKHTKKFRGHEIYINHFITLLPSDNPEATSSIEQPAGSHVFPFAFNLPITCPSSFEGRRGYVRYFCKATIDRPWKFDSHVRRSFSVIHHLDLNRFPTITMPVLVEETEVLTSCCCTDGPVDVSFQLNKSGYVPGEPIAFTVNVNNRSKSSVTQLDVDLVQTTNYVGYSDNFFSSGSPHYHPKEETFPLFHTLWQVGPDEQKIVNQTAYVPSLPPSILEGCAIIDIQYTVTCRVLAGGHKVMLAARAMLGTIPVREVNPGQPYVFPVSVNMMEPGLTPSAPPASMPPPYEEALGPPPSYNECVFGRTAIHDDDDDEHTAREESWAPAYPYYDWDQHIRNSQLQQPPQ